MRLKVYAIVVTLLLVLTIACGGGGSSYNPPDNGGGTPTPLPTKIAQHFNYIPGFGGTSTKTKTVATTSFDWSLTPKAYAQTTTTTVSMTGNYNGFCEELYTGSNGGEVVLFGLGQYKSSYRCGMDSDPNIQPNGGQLVVGNGVLKNLVIAAEAPTGLVAQGKVYVNGVPTSLIAQCPADESSKVRCENTSTIVTVKDGDEVSLTVSFTGPNGVVPSPAAYRVRAFLGKE